MSEYPWGPHGPRSDPHSVTPNPTPSYVEPSWTPAPSWPQPSSPGYAGGGYAGGPAAPAYSGPPRPRRRTLWLAIPLAWFLGPFGLLYAIGDSKPQLIGLATFMAGATMMHYSNSVPPAPPRFHPILMICVAWSIFAIPAYNRRQKAAEAKLTTVEKVTDAE